MIWGGDASCEHEWGDNLHRAGYRASDTNPGKLQSMATQNRNVGHSNFCQKCGAWKGAFGLEPTPELYVQHTVEIMQEIKRVLRKDGVCFLNLGDSYFASGGAHKPEHANPGLSKSAQRGGVPHGGQNHPNLKPKDMCLIPFRVAIALQEDGWWVRSVIIWNKPNPMPESVQDRPTNSHEYILMLTKSGGALFWTHPRKRGTRIKPKPDYIWKHKKTGLEVDYAPFSARIVKKFWTRRNLWQGHDYYWDIDAVREDYSPTVRWGGDKYKGAVKQYPNSEDAGLARERSCYPNTGRNIRDVWTFPTQPFPEAHFAVFPEKLPELCIKAATSEKGCCPKCGAPWARVIDRQVEGELEDRPYCGKGQLRSNGTAGGQGTQHSSLGQQDKITRQTVDWRPTCNCGLEETTPCTVLDPFAGSATSLLVAQKLQRKAVGYELSKDYCKLDEARLRSYMPLWEIVK